MLRELTGPGNELASVGAELLGIAADVVERFADQKIGVADASIVALAERYRTDRILTPDRRRFDVLRSADGTPLRLLP